MENIKLEKSEQEKIQILRENLKVLDVLDKYLILGHGTREAIMPVIMKDGLKAIDFNIGTTTSSFFDSSLPYSQQPDAVFHKILNWPHHYFKAIVVIAIPYPEGEQGGGSRYCNSVFEKISDDQKKLPENAGLNYVVPPEFIKGYIDVNTLQFVANPKYDPDKKVTVKDHLGGDFLEDAYKGQEENCPVLFPSPTDANNVGENNEEVW